MKILFLLITSIVWVDCIPYTESPKGIIDGINRTFELSYEPNPNAPITIRTSTGQIYAQDYELNGKVIVLKEGKQPKNGEYIWIYYRIGDSCQ